MAVDPAVSRAHVEVELEGSHHFLRGLGWTLDWQPDSLKLRAEISATDGQRFVYEFTFDDYRELPPLIDAVYPDDENEKNTTRCFPEGGFGYMHPHNVICAPWSRRAYKAIDPQGPHGEWDISKWSSALPSGQSGPAKSYVGDFLAALHHVVNCPAYRGRRS